MNGNEFRYLEKLDSSQRASMDATEIYKACVAVANNGLEHDAEATLPQTHRELLEIRRRFKRSDLNGAREILTRLADQNLSDLLEGDRLFLYANLLHRGDDQISATTYMLRAAECFDKAGDRYRAVRARINRWVCIADLNICLSGEMVALEQLARREGFMDMVALVQRTRTFELLRASQVQAATAQAQLAVQSYELDGCPEDAAMAMCLVAIGQLLQGDLENAKETLNRILITDGKVKDYIQACKTLIGGRVPKFSSGHPLAGIPWKSFLPKINSLHAKLISRLKLGPATRDQLIAELWGANALDPSYCKRLYTAISAIRKSANANVQFDGEFYKL